MIAKRTAQPVMGRAQIKPGSPVVNVATPKECAACRLFKHFYRTNKRAAAEHSDHRRNTIMRAGCGETCLKRTQFRLLA